jgi:N-acetylmuramoyl-L-alanine amidase
LYVEAQKTFTVVIDPGHGGKDSGCVGAFTKEKSINLTVSLQLGKLIEQYHKDVRVVYTRQDDVFIPLDERANIANRNKADLFISIHVNAVKRGHAAGTETYTIGLGNSDENLEVAMRENSVILMEDDYLRKYEGFDPKSSESYIIFELIQNKHMEQSVSLASEIQKAFVHAKRHNRGVRQAGLLVLRKTSMPSVLVELGFISNRDEERFMASKAGQTVLSQAIYRAFSNYIYDYGRKLGVIKDKPVEMESAVARTDASNINRSTSQSAADASNNEDEILYKVQLLTSDKKLSEKDKRFKGYKEISYYIEKGIYKYTYGATTDYRKIREMQKKAAKDFKGAFIIRIKDGIRIYQ